MGLHGNRAILEKISIRLELLVCMLWFNFILGSNFIFLIIIHYHTQKQKKIKFEPRIKLNHSIYTNRKTNQQAHSVLICKVIYM